MIQKNQLQEDPSQFYKGISLKLTAHLLFAFLGVLFKWLGDTGHFVEIGLWSGAFGLLCCLSFLYVSGLIKNLKLRNAHISLLFVPLNITGFVFSFLTYQNLSILVATLIFSLVPIIATLLSWLFLNEKMSKRFLISFILCFAGVMILIEPWQLSYDQNWYGFLYAFICVFTFSAEIVIMRHIGRSSLDHPVAITSYYFGALALICFGVIVWRPEFTILSPIETPLLALLGLFDGAAVSLGYLALLYIAASRASLLGYTQLIWAALFDYFFFQTIPGIETIGGGALIILGSFILIERKRKNDLADTIPNP